MLERLLLLWLTLLSLLAYVCGCLFRLDGEWMIGIVMVGCVPGAMASNVLTLAAGGNVSYSVSLTTSATLFSPLVVPFALWLALSKWVPISPLQVSLKLTWMVVLPVVTGYVLSRYVAVWEKVARRAAATVANLTILLIIACVIAATREQLATFNARILLALLVINIAGYLAGSLGGLLLRLPRPMRRALTLEVGMQNAGLGTVLALDLFRETPTAAIPPAIYMFGCMFTGTILARCWAEFGRKEEEAV